MKYVYKIVSALCALAVLPALVFSPILYYDISSTALQGIFLAGQLAGSETIANAMEEYGLESAPTGIADTLSIYGMSDFAGLFSGADTGDSLSKIELMLPSLYATIAALVLIVVCAIVTVVLAFACKDNRKVIASSIAGVASSLLFVVLLENTVYPIASGMISINTFIDSFLASLIAKVEEISIAPAFYLIPALFGFIALWTVLYNATLPEKEKAERLKMIG